ncbi:major facilitator superfamily domain-containing protein [Aspergillus caelatus]|uniref:Major facilitator superfamily domain-containing protein n=2 Tax=Aspergillus subgen. Circumdati TaxID=2720871 RepID=A0A5N7ADE7_9EURO|nr:major facilitator superfamily domain-containing protein [Aspergillus caelatus]KAE8367891.1 major facilitator superfamily domain-containing protein [Aspergillus caelatus]KAE8421560.1 major facilitator superfamily domain-containing protein [Aspergillus pseudocaelatus]
MGFLEKFSGATPAADNGDTEAHRPKNAAEASGDQILAVETDSSRLSLEARNEKEAQEHPNQVTRDAHLGQQKAEAAALVWSKKAVRFTYGWIWVCFFMMALQSALSSTVMLAAYADFQQAPQVATSNILYSIIGGVLKLPIARMLNLWGRAEGLLVFIGVYTLGLIILAACNGPDSFAAGNVLFWVGYNSVYYILDVFIADTSGLRNRAFAFAFVSTPFICTAFTAPLAGQSFVNHTGWRWGYGVFAIVVPVTLCPLAVVFKYYERKAIKTGVFKREPSGRNLVQSIVYYFHEFDVIGALILMAAWILLLLPFSLATYGRAQYKSAAFIAEVVVGFCLLFVFAAWEKWFARAHFVSYELLKKRTVLGACGMAAISFFSFYCWDQYFMNFCIVVYNLSLSMGGYMAQIYNVGTTFWGVGFGIWVRFTKHFKYACLFFALPLMILGAGLMIHFRGEGGGDIGYVIMCQIFIAFGGGTIVLGNDMAVMAAADREGVPMMLALLGLFNSLGGAIGYAVAAAIYNNTWLEALESRLPSDMLSQANEIYLGGYTLQVTYDMGGPTRDAINYAWGRTQMYGSIAATCLLALGIPCIAIWKNYNVDKKQNKGTMI